MSGLTSSTPPPSATSAAGEFGAAGVPARRRRGAWVDALAILVGFLVVGGLAGWAWEALWTAPKGVASSGVWVPTPQGLPHEFDGTGLYVVIALGVGVVLGAVAAARLDRHEIVTLAALIVGATAGGWLMYAVGTSLGPSDADMVASRAKDGTPILLNLTLASKAAFVAMPWGAVIGAAATFLLSRRR